MKYTHDKEFENWIDQYTRPLLDRAFYLLSDKIEAEDMVQEVFMMAYTKRATFKGKSRPLTWLQSILKNKVADFYRQKYKTPTDVSLSAFFDKHGNWKDPTITNPWEENIDEESFFDLQQCLEQLPKRWKILVKSYYLEQKKNHELCQEMGITSTNLWKILQRSRLHLRSCMENN